MRVTLAPRCRSCSGGWLKWFLWAICCVLEWLTRSTYWSIWKKRLAIGTTQAVTRSSTCQFRAGVTRYWAPTRYRVSLLPQTSSVTFRMRRSKTLRRRLISRNIEIQKWKVENTCVWKSKNVSNLFVKIKQVWFWFYLFHCSTVKDKIWVICSSINLFIHSHSMVELSTKNVLKSKIRN